MWRHRWIVPKEGTWVPGPAEVPGSLSGRFGAFNLCHDASQRTHSDTIPLPPSYKAMQVIPAEGLYS